MTKTSQKQRIANGRNAQASTGPASENGKSASAQNALKHGLRAAKVVVVPEIEDPAESSEHREAVLESLQPADYFESVLAERIAVQTWRMARACRYETEMIQTAQERVEDTLNEHRRLFSERGIGDTHPEDIRDRFQDAKSALRAFKKLPDLTEDTAIKPDDAARIVWLAFEAIELDIDVALPGIPDDADLYELAEHDGFTAGQVRGCIAAVADAADMRVSELMQAMDDCSRLELIQARMRAEDSERDIALMRRKMLLPVEDRNHEKLQRYETSIERSLFKTLHELQRLQEKRAGGHVPSPVAIDVDVSTGE